MTSRFLNSRGILCSLRRVRRLAPRAVHRTVKRRQTERNNSCRPQPPRTSGLHRSCLSARSRDSIEASCLLPFVPTTTQSRTRWTWRCRRPRLEDVRSPPPPPPERALFCLFVFVLRAAKRRDGVFVLSCPGIASVPRHGSRASVVREHEELCGTRGIETETESEGGSDGRR